MTVDLKVGRPCPHCNLPGHDLVELLEGWCGFCRQFAADRRRTWFIPVFRLRSGRGDPTVERCDPSVLGNWERTGRQPVSYSTVRLRCGEEGLLKTVFVCVDYWPCGEPEPLLFETVLMHMHTGRKFDEFTRRYATYEAAAVGHLDALKRLSALQPQ